MFYEKNIQKDEVEKKKKPGYRFRRIVRSIAYGYYWLVRGKPSSKGFYFKVIDFYPATSFWCSHYENFEILTKHAEWYAWKRGIRRPKLVSEQKSDAKGGIRR